MTTVVIPYYNAAEYIEQAVRSALEQTVAPQVVVIGDGQPVPLTFEHPRLTVYELPENHGTYFAIQLALLASPHRWFSVLGADDYLDPDHLERLIALGKPAVTMSSVSLSVNGGPERVYRSKGSFDVGVHDAAMLRSIGGYNPAERIGQDTLTMRLIRRTYGLTVSDCPTYHRRKRPDTLTTGTQYGHRSTARREMRARNRAVWVRCLHLHSRREIREYRASLVPTEVREALNVHAAALQMLLWERAA